MKWKKAHPAESPVGWLIAAGIVALASSPTVRKTVRKAVVKGTAYVMDAAERIQSKWVREEKPSEATVYPFDFRGAVSGVQEAETPCNPGISVPENTTAVEEKDDLDFIGDEPMLSVEIESRDDKQDSPYERRDQQ
jgi:hypothetical protein